MRIALACDHAAYEEKSAVRAHLEGRGHEVRDFGTNGPDSVDYPDLAAPAARAVASDEADRAVLICGTGIGVSMSANRIHGCRAAVLWNAASAEMSRRHNNANVACFGVRLQTLDDILRILDMWLTTPFDGGRHERRVAKIEAL